MAAGVVPAAGSPFGPCESDCTHRDCAANRADAEGACVHCGEPIGYERPFYRYERTTHERLAHATCAETAADETAATRSEALPPGSPSFFSLRATGRSATWLIARSGCVAHLTETDDGNTFYAACGFVFQDLRHPQPVTANRCRKCRTHERTQVAR